MAKRLFSDVEIQRLRTLFQEFDEDGSGAISPVEAEQSINKFGIKVTKDQVLDLVKKVDSDRSGSINFVEFMKFATFAKETQIETEKVIKSREFSLGAAAEPTGAAGATHGATGATHGAPGATGAPGAGHKSEELPEKLIEKIKKLFKEFDKDNSGTVEAAEISAIMEKFGVKLTPGQVNGLIRLVDVDNSGELDLDEFIELVRLALNPGSTPRLKKSTTLKKKFLNAPPADSEPTNVKSRSFDASPANSEPTNVKSRSFNPSPEDSGSAPAPAANSGFGSAPAPAANSGFGSGSAPAPAANSGLGSAPAPAANSGLGSAPAPAANSGLGSAPAPAANSGLGSAPAPAPAGNSGLGSAPAPAPAGNSGYGSAPAPAGNSGYGSAPAPAGNSGYGSTPAPAGNSGYGSTPAPAGNSGFGSAPAGNSGYGSAPAPAAKSGFGSAPAPAANSEPTNVKSRSFNPSPVDSEHAPAANSGFGSAPAAHSGSEGSTSLAVAVNPNSDAVGNVDFFGTLPLTLRNKLALTTPVRPFSFVLKEALTSGTYKIQLISQLYAPAWGRWAGLVKPENVNLKEYHIIEENTLDHDVTQISILGVKSGGKWRHKKADYVQPAGRVDLVLEYQSDAGTLLASWNGQVLPFGVNKIPQGQQRFTFELPNELELTIQSLVKVPTPTLKPTGHFDFYPY